MIAEMCDSFAAADNAAAAKLHQRLMPLVQACFLASGIRHASSEPLEICGFPRWRLQVACGPRFRG